jgi:hypothetical protein
MFGHKRNNTVSKFNKQKADKRFLNVRYNAEKNSAAMPLLAFF